MAEEGKGAEVKSEEAAAAPAKPRKKKGRFKERKKKAAVADLTELDHHPTFVDCFEYVDDEAAVLAEELLADAVPTGAVYTDAQFGGMDAVYKDYSHPPMGALPADLIQWLRIGAKEIGGGVDNPELFPADWNKATDGEDGEDGEGGEGKSDAAGEAKDGENPEESAPQRFPARLDNIMQGQLGNRWFLNALTPLLNRVDVLARCFVSKRYAAKGLYTLKLFKEGRWRYVHVDDTIPCDMAGQPLFSKSSNPNAVWIMLLEKAYAKMHGCYEKLATGVVEEAMRDLTLGIALDVTMPRPNVNDMGEGVPVDYAAQSAASAALGIPVEGDADPTQALWERLSRVVPLNRDNRMVLRFKRAEGIAVAVRSGAAVPLKSGRSVDPRRCVMTGRGYALHALLQIEDPENKAQFRLVVMRNPWGLRPWGGDWGHGDVKWDENPRIKGLVSSICPEFSWNPEDGMFVMSWADFCVQYDTIHAVRIPPGDWTLNRFQGQWNEDSITDGRGGRPGAPDFAINPMFGFEYTGGAKPECMVCVSQRESRWRSDDGEALRTSVVSSGDKRLPGLGFAIVKLTGDHLRLHEYWPAKVVATSAVAGVTAACVRSRDSSNACFTLTEGRYAVVPFTYEGGEGGGDNAFYIDMWSDYDFEIFECFQEDAVSEAPDSEDESDGEQAEADGEGKGNEAGDAGGKDGNGDAGGKDGEGQVEKKKKKAKRDPDFMRLEASRQVTENLEELTMMSMQRTMSDLCISVRDLKKEIKDLEGNVRRIAATR